MSCPCRAEQTRGGPGHGTGRVLALHYVRGQLEYFVEACLSEAVWMGDRYADQDGISAAGPYLFEGGRQVSDRAVGQVKSFLSGYYRRKRRERAEREAAVGPLTRVWAAHPIMDEEVSFGADRAPAKWWREQLEPFGFDVRVENVDDNPGLAP